MMDVVLLRLNGAKFLHDAFCDPFYQICPRAKIFIDFHGNMIAEHVRDRSWDVHRYMRQLRQRKHTWKDMFWKVRRGDENQSWMNGSCHADVDLFGSVLGHGQCAQLSAVSPELCLGRI